MFPRISRLRPLAAPAASIIPTSTRFLLPSLPMRCRSFASTIGESTSSSPPSPLPPSPSSSISVEPVAAALQQTTASEQTTESTSPESKAKPQLPYFVGRNNFNRLGVYQKRARGGNLKVTLLKRGEGNLQALKHDLKEALQLPEADVSVNSTTRHIVVRGHMRDEVMNFLLTMGF